MEITITATKTKTFELKGIDLYDAVDTFRQLNPEWRIEVVDDRELWGWCEISGKPIFHDDQFVEDEDGIKILKSEL